MLDEKALVQTETAIDLLVPLRTGPCSTVRKPSAVCHGRRVARLTSFWVVIRMAVAVPDFKRISELLVPPQHKLLRIRRGDGQYLGY